MGGGYAHRRRVATPGSFAAPGHIKLPLLCALIAASSVRPGSAASRRPNLGDFCAPGNSRHLLEALKHRSDGGKNVVLAVSNGGDSAAFHEMTEWWVRDVERTGTPYLFMAMDEAQCDKIEDNLEAGLKWDPPEGWADGAASRVTGSRRALLDGPKAAEEHSRNDWRRSPGASAPRCGYCSLRYNNMVADHMMLQRLRYKLLFDVIHLGFNGLIADLDIVFHQNPFIYLDRLKPFAMSAWLEGLPVATNGGLFFARGDKDPKTGRDRVVARWVLGEFLRRQHEVFRNPEVGWKAIGDNLVPKMSMEDVRSHYGDKASFIQHVTDDQDMIRDALNSATGGGITEKAAYRGRTHELALHTNHNATDAERIQREAHESPARDKVREKDPDWPDFSDTAVKELACYSHEEAGRTPGWVELSIPGTGVVEKIVRAPDWLLRGPPQPVECGGDARRGMRPAAVVHCVGKAPNCLYPEKWRPGAKPEGHVRRRLIESWRRAWRQAGWGGGTGDEEAREVTDIQETKDDFFLLHSWDAIVARLGVNKDAASGVGVTAQTPVPIRVEE